MRKWLVSNPKKADQKKKPEEEAADEEEQEGDFPKTDGVLLIFGGPTACESKHEHKVMHKEVFAAEPATPTYLRWSESAITFDRADHPNSVPQPGRIVSSRCLMTIYRVSACMGGLKIECLNQNLVTRLRSFK